MSSKGSCSFLPLSSASFFLMLHCQSVSTSRLRRNTLKISAGRDTGTQAIPSKSSSVTLCHFPENSAKPCWNTINRVFQLQGITFWHFTTFCRNLCFQCRIHQMGTQDFYLAMCLIQHLFLSSKTISSKNCTTQASHFLFLMLRQVGNRKWNGFNLLEFSHFALLQKEPSKKSESSQHSNHSFPVAKSSHLQLSITDPKKGI